MVLARFWGRRRLPSLRHNNVRVLEKEGSRHVHRGSICDEGFQDFGWRYDRDNGLSSIQREVSCPFLPGLPKHFDRTVSRLHMAYNPHVWSSSYSPYLLLADQDARYCSIHGFGCQEHNKQAAVDMSKVLQEEIEAEQNKIEKNMRTQGKYFGIGLHLLGRTTTWCKILIDHI